FHDLVLNGEEPRLDAGPSVVSRNIGNVRPNRIEVGRTGKAHRVPLLRGAEGGVDRAIDQHTLINGCDHNLRSVDAEKIRAANAVIVYITDPIARAYHGLGHNCIGKPEPRTEVLVVRINESPI